MPWAQDGLPVRDERAAAAHEDGWEFRNVVALGTFLDVFEVIEPEADHFARPRYWQAVSEPFERAASGRRRTFCRLLERREIAVIAPQTFAQVRRNVLIYLFQLHPLLPPHHPP